MMKTTTHANTPSRATKTEPVLLPKPGIMALSVHAAVCQFHLFPPAPPATPAPAPELQLIATDPAPVAMVQVDQVTPQARKMYTVDEVCAALGICWKTFKTRIASGLYQDFDFIDGRRHYWFAESVRDMQMTIIPTPKAGTKTDDHKIDQDKEKAKPTMLSGVVTVDSLGLAACANPAGHAIYSLGRANYEAKFRHGKVSYYVDGWPCDFESLLAIFDNIHAGQSFRVTA
jgi:hypothetical protein